MIKDNLTTTAANILFWVAAFLSPIGPVMWTMVTLIVADFITGIYAAYRAGDRIESKKMANTVSKFLIYLLVILCAWLVEMHVIPEVPIMKIVSGFIAVTELKSIFENFNKIYGIDIWSQIKEFFNRGTPPPGPAAGS